MNSGSTSFSGDRIRVLFICHGNICRSVMGQWILENLARRRGLQHRFVIDSAAVSNEESGSPIYPRARRKLEEKGVPIGDHRARQIRPEDYELFDHIYVMDRSNLHTALRRFGGDPAGKVELLLKDREIDDPWYTDNFEKAYTQILEGCQLRLAQMKR